MDIKETALNSIWKLHERLSENDKHYSNVRVTLCSFMIIVAGYVGNFFLKEYNQDFKNILIFFPILILLVNVFLSNWLVHSIKNCIERASALEECAENIINGEIKETYDGFIKIKFPKTTEPLKWSEIVSPKYFFIDEIGNMLFFSFYVLSVIIGICFWTTTPPYPNGFLITVIIVFFMCNLFFLKSAYSAMVHRNTKKKEDKNNVD